MSANQNDNGSARGQAPRYKGRAGGPATGVGRPGESIERSVSGVRGLVSLARPAARNALDGRGWRGIAEAIQTHAADGRVRTVVVQGEGRVFCAGADVDWMRSAPRSELTLIGEALDAIRACPKPVVARVQGNAYGGGVGLLAACDLVVASTEARFYLSEVRVGVAPAIVSRTVIGRVGGARFRAWALTALAVGAQTALAAGLVDSVAEPDQLDEAIDEICTALCAGEPEALASVKRLYPNGLAPREAVDELARLRERAEFAEGIAAMREKRPPIWVDP